MQPMGYKHQGNYHGHLDLGNIWTTSFDHSHFNQLNSEQYQKAQSTIVDMIHSQDRSKRQSLQCELQGTLRNQCKQCYDSMLRIVSKGQSQLTHCMRAQIVLLKYQRETQLIIQGTDSMLTTIVKHYLSLVILLGRINGIEKKATVKMFMYKKPDH